MRFLATADTDIGISRNTNQDSALIMHALSTTGEVLLAVVCDGMGGLAKGELASAVVVRQFQRWFHEELCKELMPPDMEHIGVLWTQMLREINERIRVHGTHIGANLGTTFTGILFVDGRYLIGHVGDTRVYHLNTELRQLTEDQTVVAREMRNGLMTQEQAKRDSRRNMLLQCIGASRIVVPQILCGTVEKGIYLVCSDGFRHEITEQELFTTLRPHRYMDKEAMHLAAKQLIHLVKARQEHDNITAVLVKAE